MQQSQGPEWGTGWGFLLAAIGSAVGIGNVWRFSYVVGVNGGGAFILVYLLAVLALGLPLLIAELAVGRQTRTDPVTTFHRLAPRPPWRWAGWPGVFACMAILSYYPVIAGWVGNYLFRYARDGLDIAGADSYQAYFDSLIADPLQALLWQGVILAATVFIVASGVEKGIERVSKFLMPVFVLLLLLLTAQGLASEGRGQALAFMFRPDWSALREPATYLAAVGQAFFSIGLAMGILVTYGGYLPRQVNLARAAFVIGASDTVIALLAGLVIFPAVFAHGLDPAQGTTLAFAVLPEVFAAMPGGRWLGVAFFLLLLIAALTSAVALLEVPVALAIARLGLERRRAAAGFGLLAFALGVPSALGFGLLRPTALEAPTILDRVDFLASSILLPSSGMAIALMVGWAWRPADHAGSSTLHSPMLHHLWLASLRYFLPGVILLVMLAGLGLI
ncbi:MAG: sodium-dependent transporter [Alphaproteobacteria bacterium]|nr:sodium-dependent transporter [Alphaproteobacteria bacterium]